MEYVAFGIAFFAVGGMSTVFLDPKTHGSPIVAEFQRWLMITGFYTWLGLNIGGYL
jgi:hypothetical protein